MKETQRTSYFAKKDLLQGAVLVVLCLPLIFGAILKFFYFFPVSENSLTNGFFGFLKNIVVHLYDDFSIVSWLWFLFPKPTIEPLVSFSNTIVVFLLLGILWGISSLRSGFYHIGQLSQAKQKAKELKLQQEFLEQNEKVAPKSKNRVNQKFDVFICHASEDKNEFVRPLAETLEAYGINVWYDEFTLKVGDSLRRSIDHGLVKSRFGIVVLSSAFFNKDWSQYELDGLVSREMQGKKVILPIWHRVSKDEVVEYSPSLADKLALNSSILSMPEIVEQLVDVLKDKT